MSNVRIFVLGPLIILLALGAFGYYWYTENTVLVSRILVGSFEECAAAGNPVMESFPRRCKAADGREFIEKVAVPEIEIPTPKDGAAITEVATTTPPASPAVEEPIIRVTTPSTDNVIKSPLSVTGEARGNWYFEGSFPVILYNANGQIIAQSPAKATGEWMTTEFVPFKTTLTWPASMTATSGVLVLKKDNPSGLPEHDASIEVPVKF